MVGLLNCTRHRRSESGSAEGCVRLAFSITLVRTSSCVLAASASARNSAIALTRRFADVHSHGSVARQKKHSTFAAPKLGSIPIRLFHDASRCRNSSRVTGTPSVPAFAYSLGQGGLLAFPALFDRRHDHPSNTPVESPFPQGSTAGLRFRLELRPTR